MRIRHRAFSLAFGPTGGMALICLQLILPSASHATPVNKAALDNYYGPFLARTLNACTTCHLLSANKAPENLDEFPHNSFGARLRLLGKELSREGKRNDIATRLALVANEDADGDGVPNEIELLLGHAPGDTNDKPTRKELDNAARRRSDFARFLSSYRWAPFQTVQRPPVPPVKNKSWVRNPIDAFIAAEQESRKLKPRPEAPREILLRRVYLDLIGLSPTPAEQRAFLADQSSDAYEKVVDRLLADPRYGERWGRHWMDVWRYSDWAGWSGGNQIRDSKPHIWRWRDWIVESLNRDKGYDRMVQEMLAADEIAPEDTNALRATGFLVRNYKMLSREQWMEDTVKHTSQGFLGVTMGCAKCHDHQFDPISQREYYQMRAIFEPHQVRTDRIPGQLDTAKDGLVRVFDTATNAATYLFIRGDERKPDTNRVMQPAVPVVLGGKLAVQPVTLPVLAAFPDQREFVIEDSIAASEKALADAREAFAKLKTNSTAKPDKFEEQELTVAGAEARHASLLATVNAERLEARKDSDGWKTAATAACAAQRQLAVAEAKLKLRQAQSAQAEAMTKADEAATATNNAALLDKDAAKKADKAAKDLDTARKKTVEAEKALAAADKEFQSAPSTAYKPRPVETYPAVSTGRRAAFASWMADKQNPLTARVAMNHIWLRHFGRGLVPTPADFGRNGRPPTHPQLLDWLAAELMAPSAPVKSLNRSIVESAAGRRATHEPNPSTLQPFNPSTLHPWSMKALHRLIVTSAAYRMSSTADEADLRIDPDNIYLWRMNSRRLEAEAVRDNLLYVAGDLDPGMGGPDIDNAFGLTSKRRSLYLRLAAEKEVEFLKIFDGPSVTECYERRPSVMPQQALALSNSEMAVNEARKLARLLESRTGVPPVPETSDAAKAAGSKPNSNRASSSGTGGTPVLLSSEERFVTEAFLRVLARRPTKDELAACRVFLADKSRPSAHARENLVLVLFNHNDFVTVR
ncbi:MAG TPA: DUF1549 and DUF1553 domain-containing protein [Verrucomicrobiae bacterium]